MSDHEAAPETGESESQPRPISPDLPRISYTEVLDATKHQDDKVGRFLTAIAFLTTGSVSLVFQGRVLDGRYEFASGKALPITAWCMLTFFLLTLAAVCLLLITLSIELRFPGERQVRFKSDLSKSRLFFQFISTETSPNWTERWRDDADKINKELAEQYATESHNLAERAAVKYQRTTEAAALFILALLFLALTLTFAIPSAAGLLPTDGDNYVVTWLPRLLFAAVCVGHAAIQLYSTRQFERISLGPVRRDLTNNHNRDHGLAQPNYTKDDVQRAENSASALGWLTVALSLYAAGVALPSDALSARAAGAMVATAAAVLGCWKIWARWSNTDKKSLAFRRNVAIGGLATIGAWATLLSNLGELRVAIVLMIPVVVSALAVGRQVLIARSHRTRT